MMEQFIAWVMDWASFFWLILAVVLGVLEAVTVQMVAIWFALGALVAIIPAMLGFSLWVQFTVFILVSIAALIGTRPFIRKVLKIRQVHTNADSLIGQVGVVLSDAKEGDIASGRVMIGGQDWAARTEDGSSVHKGDKVLIKAIEGAKLIVEIIG